MKSTVQIGVLTVWLNLRSSCSVKNKGQEHTRKVDILQEKTIKKEEGLWDGGVCARTCVHVFHSYFSLESPPLTPAVTVVQTAQRTPTVRRIEEGRTQERDADLAEPT